jgi:hypothetical protein
MKRRKQRVFLQKVGQASCLSVFCGMWRCDPNLSRTSELTNGNLGHAFWHCENHNRPPQGPASRFRRAAQSSRRQARPSLRDSDGNCPREQEASSFRGGWLPWRSRTTLCRGYQPRQPPRLFPFGIQGRTTILVVPYSDGQAGSSPYPARLSGRGDAG